MYFHDLSATLILLAWYLGIHNLGMLLAAKVLIPGRYRYDFVTGVGPHIASFSLGNTHFEWRVIPFVSRIRYFGEEPSIWRGLGIFVGGPVAMFIVGALIVFAILMTGTRVPSQPGAEVVFVDDPDLHLHWDDIILEANGHPIGSCADLAKELSNSHTEKYVLLVEHDGSNHLVTLNRRYEELIYTGLSGFIFRSMTRPESPGILGAISEVPQTTWDILVLQMSGTLARDRHRPPPPNIDGVIEIHIHIDNHLVFLFRIVGDLFLYGLLFLALYTVLAAANYGFMMVAALRNRPFSWVVHMRNNRKWGTVIYVCGVLWFLQMHYFPPNAASIFDTPRVESAVRRMPVDVYWFLHFRSRDS